MFHVFTDWILNIFSQMNYADIVILMAVESSFIPFPSEIVIPPAAYLAFQGKLNIFLVILSGVLGSLIGALFNYFIALSLGRKIIYSLAETKLAKALLLNKKQIEKAEEYFLKYGRVSTLIGRLVPAVRQLISIPAGLARMSIGPFIVCTILGSALWTSILATLGYFFGANQSLFKQYYVEISWGLIVFFALFLFYLARKTYYKKKKTKTIDNK